jgi:hypothetical protein
MTNDQQAAKVLERFKRVEVTVEQAFQDLCLMEEPSLKGLFEKYKAQGFKVSKNWLNVKSAQHKWMDRVRELRIQAGKLAPSDAVRHLILKGAVLSAPMVQGLQATAILCAAKNLETFEVKTAGDFSILSAFMADLQRLIHAQRGVDITSEQSVSTTSGPGPAPVGQPASNVHDLGSFKARK